MNYLQNFIKNFAIKNWQKYSFKKEWLSVILLTLILKIATSAVSIFSGYYYLDNFYFAFLNSYAAAKIFSVLTLLLIEGLNALFLAKFFKFALRVDFKTAILPLFCAILTFSISFIISCNGIALYNTNNEDFSKEINAKFNTLISEAKNEASENIKHVESYISTIQKNPECWQNGKRCILSAAQNNEIAKGFDLITSYKKDLNTKLQALETERKTELANNNAKTIATSDKYYKIVAFIMFIQVVCSAGLWFFWCKISGQDAPENEYKESIDEIYTKANNLIDNGLNVCFSQKFSLINTAFAQLENDLKTKEIAHKETKKNADNNVKKIGFNEVSLTPETPEKITPDNVSTCGVSDVETVILTPSNVVNNVKKCAECGNVLTPSQIARNAKFCCPSCRVKNYNKTHPAAKKITLKDENLKH